MIKKRHIFGANIINTMTIMKNFLKIMPVCIIAMLACGCDKDEEAVDGAYYVSLDEEFVIKYNTDITLCNGQKPQELQWITDMLRTETKNDTWKELWSMVYTEFEDMSMIHYSNMDLSAVSPDITPIENALYDCNGNWIDPAIFTEDEIENIILEIAESLAEQTICTVERRSEIGNATVHDN